MNVGSQTRPSASAKGGVKCEMGLPNLVSYLAMLSLAISSSRSSDIPGLAKRSLSRRVGSSPSSYSSVMYRRSSCQRRICLIVTASRCQTTSGLSDRT